MVPPFPYQVSDDGVSNTSPKLPSVHEIHKSVNGNSAEEAEVDLFLQKFLQPGDIVHLESANRDPVLAVHVKLANLTNVFFTVEGRWAYGHMSVFNMLVPRGIDPKLVESLVPFIPVASLNSHVGDGSIVSEHAPSHAAGPVRAFLERLRADSERIYRQNALVLDRAHETLADTSLPRALTEVQITKALLGSNDPRRPPSPAARLAVRKALNHNRFRISSEKRTHKLVNLFTLRAKRDVQTIEEVHGWLREYFESLAGMANDLKSRREKPAPAVRKIEDFITKARRLIAKSRTLRYPQYGGIGPSISNNGSQIQQIEGESFSNSDQKVITFLLAWILTEQFPRSSDLHAACCQFLQATRCYEEPWSHTPLPGRADYMSRGVGILFLQEIGVLSPFECRAFFDEKYGLPTFTASRNLDNLTSKAEQSKLNPGFVDSMSLNRRDLGTTTVYCIDDIGAKEIDDGISIERTGDQGSEFWIHVHVANPTAFFDKTHALSRLAAHMATSVYSPTRNFPMLPSWVSKDYFSLQENRPVITFSSRIDQEGNLLETKIGHGMIRNFVSISPSELVSILGEESRNESQRLVKIGEVPSVPKHRAPPNLTTTQLKELQDLRTAAKALYKRRIANGAVPFNYIRHNIRFYEDGGQPGLTSYSFSMNNSRVYLGDPAIEVETQSAKAGVKDFSAEQIVEESMILANQTVASWCSKRELPIMYRGTVPNPIQDEVFSTEELQSMISGCREKGEIPSLGLEGRTRASLGSAVTSFAPLPHKVLAVPGYAKATSPLRRFSDMIVHWQIEAALRHEERTGQMFHANKDGIEQRGALPFSKAQIQEAILTLTPRELNLSLVGRYVNRHYIVQALYQAFYYNPGQLPETFKFHVLQTPKVPELRIGHNDREIIGNLFGQEVPARFGEEWRDLDVQAGDVWDVEIFKINMWDTMIYVSPLRIESRVGADSAMLEECNEILSRIKIQRDEVHENKRRQLETSMMSSAFSK